MKKPIPMRDSRAAAERAAREYADKYRAIDPLIEVRITALADQSGWRLTAKVDDPDKGQEHWIGGLIIQMRAYPPIHGDYAVVLRKRT